MTDNTYGLSVTETDEDYAWEEWHWADYTTNDFVTDISVAAARSVLTEVFEESSIGIYSGPKGCFIRVKLGQDLGELALSFHDLFSKWLDVYGGGEEAKYLEAALETGLARIRAAA